ncbi:trimeric intracellular cation channel family protein [Ponticaulis sp.]|uniref:trimeric intracellular cation channel family protein n=1 Tax=Ponticaulis sp. TaxID=2020902 RepID=UPI000B699171|nr:trimeric intracellular cation channel family protein [Ponticaulis sp.]MAI91005.1 hypothetical protein [Ponticaulis sp.]OUX98344.1 MAG: hypothetical protein CBB65_11210 [Hyphomonadaceae bacterium TMED5]|tara:strand:+ start:135539 stop:136147 length:609 start_codon:yes stop_codon:yes gene_type:complete
MSPELILLLADRIGVCVFALSGGIAAVRKDMDLFGVITLAFFPAVGGGTLRDILLDAPVFWLEDVMSLWCAIAGGLAAFFFTRFIEDFKPLRWADACGLALFAMTGAAKAAELGFGSMIIIIMGVMTATAGGVIRDLVANRESFLFQEDIYATAALLGAIVYAGLVYFGVGEGIAFACGFVAAFALRALAIVFNLKLPKPRI